MKTLFALAAFTLSANAFALSPRQITQTLAAENVQEKIAGRQITEIRREPAPRCAGCFALSIAVYNLKDASSARLQVQGMELGDRFQVSVRESEASE